MNQIEHVDPFLDQMFSRMSPGARDLFTPNQLDEIKRAFAARSPGAHALDWRFSVQLLRASFYVVFLVGRERRSRARLRLHLPGGVIAMLCVAAAIAATYLYR